MPWNASDAKRHTQKARSPKAQRQWARVADSALSRGASEGSAIRQANGVVARRKYADGGYVQSNGYPSSSPGSPGVSGAVRDAIAALKDYMIDRPRREIQAAQEDNENAYINHGESGYAAGGPISPLASLVGDPMTMRSSMPHLGHPGGMGNPMRPPHIPIGGSLHNIDQHMAGARSLLPRLHARVGGHIQAAPPQLGEEGIGAVRNAITHLTNRDAGSAAATLRASPDAMRHPVVQYAEHALRTGQGLAPAMQGLAGMASAAPSE